MRKTGTAKSYFTQDEAESKVGKRVRSLAGYSGVPRGTGGTVVASTSRKGRSADFQVAIQWDAVRRPMPFEDMVLGAIAGGYPAERPATPLVDWFSRDEYERFVEEIEGTDRKSTR